MELVERHQDRPCLHACNTTASSVLTNLLPSLQNRRCSQMQTSWSVDNLYRRAGSTTASLPPPIQLASLRNQHCNHKAMMWLGVLLAPGALVVLVALVALLALVALPALALMAVRQSGSHASHEHSTMTSFRLTTCPSGNDSTLGSPHCSHTAMKLRVVAPEQGP